MTQRFPFLIGILFLLPISASAVCKFDDSQLQHKEFSVQFQKQKIAIIGWYHGIKEMQVAMKSVVAVLEKARLHQCGQAGEEINQALAQIGKAKTIEGQRVLGRLKQLNRKMGFSTVGLEHSPELFRKLFIDPQTNEDVSTSIVSTFSKQCPQQSNTFMRLAMVFPGPEIEFARQGKLFFRLLPLGNEDLSQSALSGLSQETKDFAQNVDQLSPEGRKAYENFGDLFLKGEPLSAEHIDALVKSLKDPERSKVKKYILEANSSILTGLKAMNEAIITNALAAKDNIAIVIGNAHVPGLRKQFESRCSAMADK